MLSYLNPLKWKRSFLLSILLLFLVVWFGFIDTYSIYARYNLAHQKDELESKIEELQKKTELLEAEIEALKANPDLLEKIAREEYGMRKKGEKVYKVIRE